MLALVKATPHTVYRVVCLKLRTRLTILHTVFNTSLQQLLHHYCRHSDRLQAWINGYEEHLQSIILTVKSMQHSEKTEGHKLSV